MPYQTSLTSLVIVLFISFIKFSMPFPQITAKAPEFTTAAVMPNKEFAEISLADYLGKWVVLLWYPYDFTFVCPTEIIAFGDRQGEFDSINTQVIAASCDSQFSHLAWINTPRADGGLGDMKIPIIADFTKEVATKYGVLLPDGGPLRGLFIIDPNGVLRHITANDRPVGRNVDETIRLVKAFQFTDVHGEVCPANWQPGDRTMHADPTKSKEYFQAVNKGGDGASAGASGGLFIQEVADKATYESSVSQAPVAIVDFWAPWCKNCKKIAPTVSRLASEMSGVKFIKVNTNEAEALSAELSVEALPTFFFYKNGAKVGEFKGSDAAKLEAAVKAL